MIAIKRPLVFALIFLIIGVFSGRILNGGEPIFVALFFVCVFAICLAIFFWKQFNFAFVFFAFCLVGFVIYGQATLVKNTELEVLATNSAEVSAKGIVTETSHTKNNRQKVVIRLESVVSSGKTINTNLHIYAILKENESVKLGQDVTFSGKLELLNTQRNPRAYDEFLYRRTRGVHYKMFPNTVEKGAVKNTPNVVLMDFRDNLARVYDVCLPKREAGVLKSMIIGETDDVDAEIAQIYRLAGIYHLISISGTHISIIALFLNRVFNKVTSQKRSALLTLAILCAYCAMTGLGVATVRAVMMFAVVTFGTLLDRPRDLLTSTATAAIILLLYQPLYLWDIGFLYSFSAIFGMCLLTPPLENVFVNVAKVRLNLPNAVVSSLKYFASCLAATLSTTPIQVIFFNYFLPYSTLVNMIVLPTASVLTVVGFLVGAIGLVAKSAAVFVSVVPFVILRFYEFVCNFFNGLPLAVNLVATPPLFVTLQFVLFMGIFALAYTKTSRKTPLFKWLLVVSVGVFLLTANIYNRLDRRLEFAMLDVGQGDCMVITQGNSTFVVDGGGSPMKKFGENTGATVLIPYLNTKGINTINGVFVTHTDMDHVGGIIELLDAKRVKTLFISTIAAGDKELYEMLLDRAEVNNVEVVEIQSGDKIELKNITFDCLFPIPNSGELEGNNSSLVLKLVYKNTSFLLTGDIEAKAEGILVAAETGLKSDVLKLAHHGSKYSQTPPFVEKVAPTFAIVSASKTNSYGHPSPSVIKYFKELDIPVYNTAVNGAIIIKTDGNVISIIDWREKY